MTDPNNTIRTARPDALTGVDPTGRTGPLTRLPTASGDQAVATSPVDCLMPGRSLALKTVPACRDQECVSPPEHPDAVVFFRSAAR